jgi:hypothetical protein
MDQDGRGDRDRELERMLAGTDRDPAPPSRESMREVKAEAKRRRQERAARERAAQAYWREQARGATGTGRARGWPWILLAVALGLTVTGIFLVVDRGLPWEARQPSNPVGPPDPSDGADAPDVEAISPFEGTPAADWRVGAKGIGIPAAERVGPYSAKQVDAAYRATKAYLKAAMLDPAVLFGSKLKPVLTTMSAESRERAQRQVKKDRKSDSDDALRWVDFANRFHPGDWQADDEIRVRGRMRAGVDDGFLEVSYVFTAAYWMKPDGGTAWTPVAIRREGSAYFTATGSGVSAPWVSGDGTTSSRSVCGSTWPYPQYLEVWPDMDSVVTASIQPLPPRDLSDPDETFEGCFTDTSGF